LAWRATPVRSRQEGLHPRQQPLEHGEDVRVQLVADRVAAFKALAAGSEGRA